MQEYFLIGWLCIFNPILDDSNCFSFFENPRKYYSLEECKLVADEKANKIALNLTSEGITITDLKVSCVVDRETKNT